MDLGNILHLNIALTVVSTAICFLKRVLCIVEINCGNILPLNIMTTVAPVLMCFANIVLMVAAVDLNNILPLNIALNVTLSIHVFLEKGGGDCRIGSW